MRDEYDFSKSRRNPYINKHESVSGKLDSSYDEAKRFLGTFTNFNKSRSAAAYETVAEDIAEFREVLRSLGDPHRDYSIVHVAGSKGKGSTSSFIASVLRAAGKRTGHLISPHLVEFTERVSIDGVAISTEEFRQAIAAMRVRMSDGFDPVARENFLKRLLAAAGIRQAKKRDVRRKFRNIHAYFNGVAFPHFSKKGVDFAVLETGMGGRLDHTNVFEQPPKKPGDFHLAVLTAMAIEHRIPLGDTIDKITFHKAGIIQPHGLSVLGPQKAEWYEKIRRVVDERRVQVNAPPVLDVHECITIVPGTERFSAYGADAEFTCNKPRLLQWLKDVGAEGAASAADFIAALESGIKLHSPLAGRHQAENLRTVLASALALNARGTTISAADVQRGVADVKWPARFEILSRDPLIIVDCCHESLSIGAFANTYKEFFGDRPIIGVTSFLRDNDIGAMCRAAASLPLQNVYCCTAPVRGREKDPAEAIKIAAPILDVEMTPVSDPIDAMKRAYHKLSGDQALVIYGDIYIAGIARTNIPKWLSEDGASAK